eukprot:2584865-Prymnesium_polylepis.1
MRRAHERGHHADGPGDRRFPVVRPPRGADRWPQGGAIAPPPAISWLAPRPSRKTPSAAQIPKDVAFDANGVPTDDPSAALKGALRTFDRGYKSSVRRAALLSARLVPRH